MKRIEGIMWIILISIVMMLTGCSYSIKFKSNEEDDIRASQGPVYMLVYDEAFNSLMCFLPLD